MNTGTRRPIKLTLVSALVIIVSGCAVTNPFVGPDMLRPDMVWKKDDRSKIYMPERDTNGLYKPNAVSVEQARLYARALQDAYREAATGQVKTRVVLDGIAIVSAATAVGMAATGGSAKTAGLLGLGAGTLMLASDQFLIATRKRIWFQGALALECVIAAANTVSGVELSHVLLDTKLQLLRTANSSLESALSRFKKQRSGIGLSGSDQTKADQTVTDAQNILDEGKAIATTVGGSKDRLNTMGQVLLSKVIEIRLRVETEIAKTEPDLLSYDQALKRLLANTQPGFLSEDELALLKAPDTNGKHKLSAPFLDPRLPKAFKSAHADLENAMAAALAARNGVVDALEKAIAAGPLKYSDTLFSNCALNESIGLGPLTVSPASQLDLAPNTAATVQAVVRGGQRPYSIITDALPSGVTASIDASDRLSVSIPSATAVAGVPVVVPVKDGQGAVANFIIGFKQSAKGASDTSTATPQPASQLDPDLQRIQNHLITLQVTPPYDLGDSGADGKWGNKTGVAIQRYLRDNFEDLKGMDEFERQFPDYSAGHSPDFSTRSKDQLIKLALSII